MAGRNDDPFFREQRAKRAARQAHALPTLITRIERRQDELTSEDKRRLAELARA